MACERRSGCGWRKYVCLMEYAPGRNATGITGAAGLVCPQSPVALLVHSISVRLNNPGMSMVIERQYEAAADGIGNGHGCAVNGSGMVAAATVPVFESCAASLMDLVAAQFA